MPSTPPATTPESVCSKPAVPLGQPVFSVPGAPLFSTGRPAKCGKVCTLRLFTHPALLLTVPADSTEVSWSGLPDPLAPSAPPQGRAAPGKPPHRKIPCTHSGMPGIFLLRSDGDHTGGVLPLSTAAAAKGGKLSPMRAFGGRRQSAHRPACFRRTAARRRSTGQTAPI